MKGGIFLFFVVFIALSQCSTNLEVLRLMQERKQAGVSRPQWNEIGQQIGNQENLHFLQRNKVYYENIKNYDEVGSTYEMRTVANYDTFLPDFHDGIEDVLITDLGVAIRGRVDSFKHYLREGAIITTIRHHRLNNFVVNPTSKMIEIIHHLTDEIIYLQTSNINYAIQDLFSIEFKSQQQLHFAREEVKNILDGIVGHNAEFIAIDSNVSNNTLININKNSATGSEFRNETLFNTPAEDGTLSIGTSVVMNAILTTHFQILSGSFDTFVFGITYTNAETEFLFRYQSPTQVNGASKQFSNFILSNPNIPSIFGPVGLYVTTKVDLHAKGSINIDGNIGYSKRAYITFSGEVSYDVLNDEFLTNQFSNDVRDGVVRSSGMIESDTGFINIATGPRIQITIFNNLTATPFSKCAISALPNLNLEMRRSSACRSSGTTQNLYYGFDVVANSDQDNTISLLSSRSYPYSTWRGCLNPPADYPFPTRDFRTNSQSTSLLEEDTEEEDAPLQAISGIDCLFQRETTENQESIHSMGTRSIEDDNQFFAGILLTGATNLNCSANTTCSLNFYFSQCNQANGNGFCTSVDTSDSTLNNYVEKSSNPVWNIKLGNTYENGGEEPSFFELRLEIKGVANYTVYNPLATCRNNSPMGCTGTLVFPGSIISISFTLSVEKTINLFDPVSITPSLFGENYLRLNLSRAKTGAASVGKKIIIEVSSSDLGTNTVGRKIKENEFDPSKFDRLRNTTFYEATISQLTDISFYRITITSAAPSTIISYLLSEKQSIGTEISYNFPQETNLLLQVPFRVVNPSQSKYNKFILQCSTGGNQGDTAVFINIDNFNDIQTLPRLENYNIVEFTALHFYLLFSIENTQNIHCLVSEVISAPIGKDISFQMRRSKQLNILQFFEFDFSYLTDYIRVDLELNKENPTDNVEILMSIVDPVTQFLPINDNFAQYYTENRDVSITAHIFPSEIIGKRGYLLFKPVGSAEPENGNRFRISNNIPLYNDIAMEYYIGGDSIITQNFRYTLSVTFNPGTTNLYAYVYGKNLTDVQFSNVYGPNLIYNRYALRPNVTTPYYPANDYLYLSLPELYTSSPGDSLEFRLIKLGDTTQTVYYSILVKEVTEIQSKTHYYAAARPTLPIIYEFQNSFTLGAEVRMLVTAGECSMSLEDQRTFKVENSVPEPDVPGASYLGVVAGRNSVFIYIYGSCEFDLYVDELFRGVAYLNSDNANVTYIRSGEFSLSITLSPPYLFNTNYLYGSADRPKNLFRSIRTSDRTFWNNVVDAFNQDPVYVFDDFYFNVSVPAISDLPEPDGDICLYIVIAKDNVVPDFQLSSNQNLIISNANFTQTSRCSQVPTPTPYPSGTPQRSPPLTRSATPSFSEGASHSSTRSPTSSRTPSGTPTNTPSNSRDPREDSSSASYLTFSFSFLFVILLCLF